MFDTEAYWLRARSERQLRSAPVLRAVLVNAVDALNGITVEEVIGSSDGSIDQSFKLATRRSSQAARSGCWSRMRRAPRIAR